MIGIRATPQVASSSATSISVSSRAAPMARARPWRLAFFGVRKNGSLRVVRPFSTAKPMVCESDSPASAAAKVWRRFAPTALRYRWTSLTSLNANSDNGSTENIINGASYFSGEAIIRIDQVIAAKLNSRLKPSAIQGSQPAMK